MMLRRPISVFLVIFTVDALPAWAQTGAAAPAVISGSRAPASPGFVPPPLNPSATPFAPGVANGVPQITPGQLPVDTVTPPAPVDEDEKAEKQQQFQQQLMQSMGQMMNSGGGGGSGGRSESAGSGGGSEASPPTSSSRSALEYNPGLKSEGGQDIKSINGCSNRTSFQFIAGYAGTACDPKKDGALDINAQLSEFILNNLNRCAAQAAGANSIASGKVFHSGVIGDARHKTTGSLHNLGMAIDINAMQITTPTGTQLFKASSRESRDMNFFKSLRTCWAEAANKERGGCLVKGRRGQEPASVGEEDADHRGHHLHLSLPFCPAEAKRRGLYFALVHALPAVMSVAHAEGATTTRRSLDLKSRGRAELFIRDQHGEPVNADQRFRVELRCPNEAKPRLLAEDLEGCEFATFEYLAPKNLIELRYRVSVLRQGRMFCGIMETKTFPAACAPPR